MSFDRSSRLDPMPEAEWAPQADSVRDLLGEVLNVHRVMAHHPELLAAWAPLRQHVAAGSSLSPRFRELAILRLAHRMGVTYEWYHHVRRALAAEMTPEEIEAIRLAAVRSLGGSRVGSSDCGRRTPRSPQRHRLDLVGANPPVHDGPDSRSDRHRGHLHHIGDGHQRHRSRNRGGIAPR